MGYIYKTKNAAMRPLPKYLSRYRDIHVLNMEIVVYRVIRNVQYIICFVVCCKSHYQIGIMIELNITIFKGGCIDKNNLLLIVQVK